MVDRGLRAPAWLEELVRTKRPPVPWRDVLRFALSITGPLALVALLGRLADPAALGAGVFATTGALAATLAPQGGPLRTRLRRVLAAAGFGALGLLAGEAATGEGWRPVVVIGVLSAVAALISSIDAALSWARCSCWSTRRCRRGCRHRCPCTSRSAGSSPADCGPRPSCSCRPAPSPATRTARRWARCSPPSATCSPPSAPPAPTTPAGR